MYAASTAFIRAAYELQYPQVVLFMM